MTTPAAESSDHPGPLPKPVVKKMRWPFPVIWLVPVLALLLTGYFFYDRLQDRGPLITLRLTDATDLKAGQTAVVHLGVQIGQISSIDLSPDQKQALVRVRLQRSAASFARRGASFWIVRPEISTQEISGLGTVLSGPLIDAIPGTGESQTEFVGLGKAPVAEQDGLTIVLKSSHLSHLQSESPVYFRGMEVGAVKDIQLSLDATTVDIQVFIRRRFVPLVRLNSQFWAVSPVDLKGSIFTGIQLKMGSISSLLSGGLAFATPDGKLGEQAENGAIFPLNDEPRKEWQSWSPRISIAPGDAGDTNKN